MTFEPEGGLFYTWLRSEHNVTMPGLLLLIQLHSPTNLTLTRMLMSGVNKVYDDKCISFERVMA